MSVEQTPSKSGRQTFFKYGRSFPYNTSPHWKIFLVLLTSVALPIRWIRLLPPSMCSSPIYGASAKVLGSAFAFDSNVTSESVVLIQPDGRSPFTFLMPQPPHLPARRSAHPS